MKKIAFYVMSTLGAFIVLALGSCQKDAANPSTVGNAAAKANLTVGLPPVLVAWSPFPAIPYAVPGQSIQSVSGAAGFTINNLGFVLGGFFYPQQTNVADLWMWTPGTQAWVKVAPFPGVYVDVYADGLGLFVIGDNAYVIQGSNVWQYNQPSNLWTAKKPFPGTARNYPTSMAINGNGYLGLGATGGSEVSQKDWWQYDPVSDSWTRKQDYKGAARQDAGGFAVNGKGYVCLGYDYTSGSMYHTLWQYDPTDDIWTQKSSWPGSGWYYPLAVTATIGGVSSGLVTDGTTLWDYNPASDSWFTIGQVKGNESYFPAVLVAANRLIFESKTGEVYLWSR